MLVYERREAPDRRAVSPPAELLEVGGLTPPLSLQSGYGNQADADQDLHGAPGADRCRGGQERHDPNVVDHLRLRAETRRPHESETVGWGREVSSSDRAARRWSLHAVRGTGMTSADEVRLTHSKSGLLCTAVLPAHRPLDGMGFNGPAVCSSHAEHVERGLPHVCCCGYVDE